MVRGLQRGGRSSRNADRAPGPQREAARHPFKMLRGGQHPGGEVSDSGHARNLTGRLRRPRRRERDRGGRRADRCLSGGLGGRAEDRGSLPQPAGILRFDPLNDWQIAALAASWAQPGMVIGLGTGRAASGFVRALGDRVRSGLAVRGIPTSRATRRLAGSLGIPLVGLAEETAVDLAVDGADEVDPDGNLIKGHGGAMARERVVAAAASRFVVLVGPEKLSPRLGSLRSVPVEVLPFAAAPVRLRLEAMGARVRLREGTDGEPYRTDNQNLLLLARFAAIPDPAGLHSRIREIPGVLDSGIFAGMADRVLVEGRDGSGPAPPAR